LREQYPIPRALSSSSQSPVDEPSFRFSKSGAPMKRDARLQSSVLWRTLESPSTQLWESQSHLKTTI
jgi:hypothetical protein